MILHKKGIIDHGFSTETIFGILLMEEMDRTSNIGEI